LDFEVSRDISDFHPMTESCPAQPSTIQRPTSEAIFERDVRRCAVFCSRFPAGIDFTGKRVLDVGSGLGALCFRAMDQGARSADGVDTNEQRTNFAIQKLGQRYPHYQGALRFHSDSLSRLPAEPRYEIILSEAAFEHIPEPAAMLDEMNTRLAPGGRIFIGFGPLFRAPRGDHGALHAPLRRVFPWAHLLFSQQYLLARLCRGQPGLNLSSLDHVGLNGLALADFRRIFHSTGLQVVFFAVNRNERRLSRVLRLLEPFPRLQEYLAFNVYCVLEKSAGSIPLSGARSPRSRA
jgi:2-polyprenyl-3-methyl-5-hydroxy-6-metoxy-1,4-benzoquinol methylase